MSGAFAPLITLCIKLESVIYREILTLTLTSPVVSITEDPPILFTSFLTLSLTTTTTSFVNDNIGKDNLFSLFTLLTVESISPISAYFNVLTPKVRLDTLKLPSVFI